MYGKVLGASTVVGTGAIALPNTGGNVALTIAAITTITVGGAILLSTVVRAVAKKAYKA
jgi:hypothetical protein